MFESATFPPVEADATPRDAALQAARAEQVRAEIPPAMVGIAALAVATIFIARSFADSVEPWLLRWWLVAMAVTPVSLLLAFIFTRLWPPDDASVLRFWRPWGRSMRLVMNLPVLISPWILLPNAEPMLRIIMVVLYVWFMATQVLANTDPHGRTWVALFGLPASAGAFLIVNDLPYAVPLAAFLALIGGSLFLLERLLIKMRLQAMERDVEQRLEVMAPLPGPPVPVLDPLPAPVASNPGLTRRQIEVLRLLAQGLSNKDIARVLDISPATVKTHVADIIAITGATNRTGASMQAQALGCFEAAALATRAMTPYGSAMRKLISALALFAATAAPVAAQPAGWTLTPGNETAALVFGTPVTDRDAFRLDCSGGMMSISTWAPSPPRGVVGGDFPTTIRVMFGNRELSFAATGRVTGPGGATRVDARIVDPAAFLTSLGQVNRLTTVIFAGRRMAASPTADQNAGFRKACGF